MANQPGKQNAAGKDCYYPECLQCCCTSGKNGESGCQYEELAGTIKVTNGPASEVFRGMLYGCLLSIVIIIIVSLILYLWPNG
jgi:hypothetical protein